MFQRSAGPPDRGVLARHGGSREGLMDQAMERYRVTLEPPVLSILRIVVGLAYLQHGLNKLFNFPPSANHPAYSLFSLNPGVAGLLETLGSLFIIFGLFTRPVAFLLSGEMAIAYFTVDIHRGFYPLLNGGELVMLYCFAFFYLFVAGGGSWSLDRLLAQGRVGSATFSAASRG
jgi:putative oxidoreductase